MTAIPGFSREMLARTLEGMLDWRLINCSCKPERWLRTVTKDVTMIYFRWCFGVESARPWGARQGGVLGQGQRAPSPPARGLGERCISFSSGVRGEVPAGIDLGTFSTKQKLSPQRNFCQKRDTVSGHCWSGAQFGTFSDVCQIFAWKFGVFTHLTPPSYGPDVNLHCM